MKMALVLRKRMPKIRKSSLRRSRAKRNLKERIKHVWESPDTYEPQI